MYVADVTVFLVERGMCGVGRKDRVTNEHIMRQPIDSLILQRRSLNTVLSSLII